MIADFPARGGSEHFSDRFDLRARQLPDQLCRPGYERRLSGRSQTLEGRAPLATSSGWCFIERGGESRLEWSWLESLAGKRKFNGQKCAGERHLWRGGDSRVPRISVPTADKWAKRASANEGMM